MSVEAVALGAADQLRAAVLRRVCRVRVLRPVLADRRRRVMVGQACAVLSAAVLALRAPLISLWLGAALFGVPHVLAGVRAVAVRRRASRFTLGCAAAGAVVGVAQLAGAGDGSLRLFVLLFAAALAWEILAARRDALVTAAACGAVVLAAAAALRAPRLAVVIMAHLHGVASLVYFAICARRRGIPVWPLALGAGGLMVAAAAGALDGAMASTLLAPRGAARSIAAEAVGAALPGAGAAVFHRALFLYAFGQSLHFAVWLRLLPDVDRPSPTPKPFRRALSELAADFGRLAVPLVLLAGLSIAVMLAGGGAAREAYFALTYFHVGLEAAALARLALARREQPSAEAQAAPVARGWAS
jgi:hypothetical protein